MAGTEWMVYGAYGYTGRLIVERAVALGLRPRLAGRSAEKLRPLAERWQLPWAAFDLTDPQRIVAALQDVALVIHAAGPFIHTSRPMVEACLAAGVHYLDVTGEIAVFEHIFTYHAAAQARGIALIPGVGFDVVPSDCLARYVADRLPDAHRLEIAIATLGQPSGGTTKTTLNALATGGLVRRQGQLVAWPLGQGARQVRFSDRVRRVLPIPWGDLATAYRSTGIPDITTYMAFPPALIQSAPWALPVAQRLMGWQPVRRVAQAAVGRMIDGPDAEARQAGRCYLWAQATAPDGRMAQAWLETVEGYRFTVEAALACRARTLAQQPAGALTPAQAFGADLTLEVAGTRRLDRLPSP